MSAYVIAMIDVRDPDTYRKYTDRSPEAVKRHGGTFLAVGQPEETLEGESYDQRLVLLEFPSTEQAAAWFNDPDYQSAAEFRRASAASRFLLIDGVEPKATT